MGIVRQIVRYVNYVTVVLVIIMMVMVVADVFMRDAFNSPITGTAEVVSLAMVSMVLGVGWCAVKGQHLTVNIIMERVPRRARLITDIITLLASLGMGVIMAWRAFIEAGWEKRFGYTASDLVLIPTFPFWWAYAVGLCLLCLVIVTMIIQKISEAAKNES